MEVAGEANHIQHNFLRHEPRQGSAGRDHHGEQGRVCTPGSAGKDGRGRARCIGEGAPGEVKLGRVGGRRMLATVEPWHGAGVAIYAEKPGAVGEDDDRNRAHRRTRPRLGRLRRRRQRRARRRLARRPKPGVAIYAVDREGALKSKTMVDDGGMATEDLIVGDFNGDKQPDIVASGRSTRNIKIYWNETKRKPRVAGICGAHGAWEIPADLRGDLS